MRITHAPINVACFRLGSAAHNEGASTLLKNALHGETSIGQVIDRPSLGNQGVTLDLVAGDRYRLSPHGSNPRYFLRSSA